MSHAHKISLPSRCCIAVVASVFVVVALVHRGVVVAAEVAVAVDAVWLVLLLLCLAVLLFWFVVIANVIVIAVVGVVFVAFYFGQNHINHRDWNHCAVHY